jgi:hypothetical protein
MENIVPCLGRVQCLMLRLKERASWKIDVMAVTELTFQSLMLPLNACAPENIRSMLDTLPTFQYVRS